MFGTLEYLGGNCSSAVVNVTGQGRLLVQLQVCTLPSPCQLLKAVTSDFVLPFRQVCVGFIKMTGVAAISPQRL